MFHKRLWRAFNETDTSRTLASVQRRARPSRHGDVRHEQGNKPDWNRERVDIWQSSQLAMAQRAASGGCCRGMEHRKRASKLPHSPGLVAVDAEGGRKTDHLDIPNERRAETRHPS